jgi:hypothetical protein
VEGLETLLRVKREMLLEILPLVVAHRAGSGRYLQQLLGLLKVLADELKVAEHAVGNADEAARGFENILRRMMSGNRRANRGKLATEARSREAISQTSSEMGMFCEDTWQASTRCCCLRNGSSA